MSVPVYLDRAIFFSLPLKKEFLRKWTVRKSISEFCSCLASSGLDGRPSCGRGLYAVNLDQQDRCNLSRREMKGRLEPSSTRKCNTFITRQPQLQLFREVKIVCRCVTDTMKIYRVSQLTVFKAQISGERRVISHHPGGVTSR